MPIKLAQSMIPLQSQVANASYTSPYNHFGAADWALMIIYLVAVFGLGFVFFAFNKWKKTTSTKSFFDGGGKTPAIVIGFSIYATGLSSITYLALPGLAFSTGWMWTFATITILFVTPVVIKWVIPFFRRIQESTAYAYLGKRFHYSLRAISSISFCIFHIFRIAIVLYIPTLALGLFININPYLLLFILGAIVIFSTVMGGFRSVMWSDFIQGIILLAGIVFIISYGLAKTNWSNPSLKYQVIFQKSQWNITAVSGGIFFIFVSNYINSMFSYIGSQDIVQRYKANKDVNQTKRSLWINFFLTLLTIFLFFGAGSVLYTYYSSHGVNVDDKNAISAIVLGNPNASVPGNQLIPKFIVTVLPVGLSGLIISAVFAASQSTISSSLSAFSNTLIVDFVQELSDRYKDNKNDKELKIISQVIVVLAGIFGIGVSMLLVLTNQDDLIQYFLAIVGLLGGPIVSLFILGIFTKRTNWKGTLIGICLGFAIGLALWIPSQKFIPEKNRLIFSSQYIAIIPFSTSIIAAYLFSFAFSSKNFYKQINMNVWESTAEFKQLIITEKKLAAATSKIRFWRPKISKEQIASMVLEYENLEQTVKNQTLRNNSTF